MFKTTLPGAGLFRAVFRTVVATLALTAVARGEALPQRIVSFNLCSDQLILSLADSDQIAGLSPYAVNPVLSVMTAEGARFTRLDWNAESVIAVRPDLVVTGPSDRPTQAMLAALGMPVATIGLVSDIDAAMSEAREVGRWVGHPERGEAMAQSIAKAAQRLKAASAASSRTALIIERGGYANGPQSLAAAMLAIAGLKPPAGGPTGYGGFVSLEHLLVIRPDILVLKDEPSAAADQGAVFLTHPALRALYPPARRIDLPTRYTLCGGPALIDGLNYLADKLSGSR
jgi:iron complex transport system substrate-binding protein